MPTITTRGVASAKGFGFAGAKGIPIGALTLVGTTPLPSGANYEEGQNNMGFSPDGNYLYVASRDSSGTNVYQYSVNSSTGALTYIATYGTTGGGSSNFNSVVVTANNVYAGTNTASNPQIWAWTRDGSTGNLSGSASVTAQGSTAINGLGISPDGSRIFVGGNEGLLGFNVSGTSLTQLTTSGAYPYNLWGGFSQQLFRNALSFNSNIGYAGASINSGNCIGSCSIVPVGPNITYGFTTLVSSSSSVYNCFSFANITSSTATVYAAASTTTGAGVDVFVGSCDNYASGNPTISNTYNNIDANGYPVGITASPDNLNLYVTNQAVGVTYVFAISGSTLNQLPGTYGTVASGSTYSNSCVVVSPNNQFVYIYDSNLFNVICYSRYL